MARVALDNSFLTESQLLKTLAKHALPERIVEVVARHEKWSKLVNIRVALLRHPRVPAEIVPALVPGLPRHEMEDLIQLSRLPESVRVQLREELSQKK